MGQLYLAPGRLAQVCSTCIFIHSRPQTERAVAIWASTFHSECSVPESPKSASTLKASADIMLLNIPLLMPVT